MLQRSYGWNLGIAYLPDARPAAAADLARRPGDVLDAIARADALPAERRPHRAQPQPPRRRGPALGDRLRRLPLPLPRPRPARARPAATLPAGPPPRRPRRRRGPLPALDLAALVAAAPVGLDRGRGHRPRRPQPARWPATSPPGRRSAEIGPKLRRRIGEQRLGRPRRMRPVAVDHHDLSGDAPGVLGLVGGDDQRRRRARRGSARPGPASRPGAPARAPRTARPAAAAAGPAAAPAPAPPAAARRPRAAPGRRSPSPASPTAASAASTRAQPAAVEPQVGPQPEADVLPPPSGARRGCAPGRAASPAAPPARSPVMSRPSQRIRPRAGATKPAMAASSVLLPEPDGPISAVALPGSSVEVGGHAASRPGRSRRPQAPASSRPPRSKTQKSAIGQRHQHQRHPGRGLGPVGRHQLLHQERQRRHLRRREERDHPEIAHGERRRQPGGEAHRPPQPRPGHEAEPREAARSRGCRPAARPRVRASVSAGSSARSTKGSAIAALTVAVTGSASAKGSASG